MKVYEKIYNYYVSQIENKSLLPGDRMPSLRESEKMLNASRTSIETAYLQLAADGYIYAVEKVGYFISETAGRFFEQAKTKNDITTQTASEFKYDLATIGEDKTVSCLKLWQRYMKSALRQEDRLLNYPFSQGEEDLRHEIAVHVRKTRNIICSMDDIVIGAGFQNLLQILIALIPDGKTISFPTKNFSDGAMTFKKAGFQVNYRDKNSHVIYVTPAYMTKWGEVMTMKRRRELIEHSLKDNHLIIEDDYQNDFVFSTKPTPSLYAMTGGENIAFLGSFSRVLLPSVRISFLILPRGTRGEYEAIKSYYNQTASVAEQIALAQFLRDGHLNRHIKKMKRLYDEKRQLMKLALEQTFKDDCRVLMGESGMEMALLLSDKYDLCKAKSNVVKTDYIQGKAKEPMLLLSCSRIDKELILQAIRELHKSLR